MISTAMDQVQSCSVCVPAATKKCVGNCKGCVSKMHSYGFPSIMKHSIPLSINDFERWLNSLNYAIRRTDNLMITGDNVDPMQNLEFLMFLTIILRKILYGGFTKKELQSVGFSVDDAVAKFLESDIGISIFSTSLWGLKNETNQSIARLPKSKIIDIGKLCETIKRSGMILRLSLNMSKDLMDDVGWDIGRLIDECKKLGADQLTIRGIYDEGDSEQAQWAREHRVPKKFLEEIERHILENKDARDVDFLPTGYARVFIKGMSTVVDPDCMNEVKSVKVAQKYLVIRTDGNVYDDWGPYSRVC